EDPMAAGRPLTWATQSPQFLRLLCGHDGDAEIHAVDGTRVVARLRVAVRKRLTVRVAFLYVQNRRDGTARTPGGEEKFLGMLNRIYRAQTNIEFEMLPGAARPLPLTDRLGREINDYAGHGEEWEAIVRHRVPGARINFFFVREVEKESERGRDPSTGRRRRD